MNSQPVNGDDTPPADYDSENDEEMSKTNGATAKNTAQNDGPMSEASEGDHEVLDSNKTQEASHARCILDLSYSKFKWNINDDFTKFHRPDIQSLYDKERQALQAAEDFATNENAAVKSRISIDTKGSVQVHSQAKEDHGVSLPIQIIDRDLIKRKNKKRGIINADEYFKDRYKLSLRDGKFCLFEHIDENPIFVNNFGMVSKLHRYLYNDQALPNEDFLKRHNSKIMHMGPYGIQRVLKTQNSKLPLLGNIDKTMF